MTPQIIDKNENWRGKWFGMVSGKGAVTSLLTVWFSNKQESTG
jgi:hypothetical protein